MDNFRRAFGRLWKRICFHSQLVRILYNLTIKHGRRKLLKMNIGVGQFQYTKPSVSVNSGQSFSEKRSYLRKTSKVIENQLYRSLQTCKVEYKNHYIA